MIFVIPFKHIDIFSFIVFYQIRNNLCCFIFTLTNEIFYSTLKNEKSNYKSAALTAVTFNAHIYLLYHSHEYEGII
jgi:hypothetical protein